MGTPTKGVPVQVGGESKTLRFDWNAIVRLEEETRSEQWPEGMPLLAFLGAVQNVSPRAIEVGLWIGLLHSDPGLSRERVRAMLGDASFIEVMQALVKALQSLAPTGSKNEGNGSPAAT